MINVLINGCNGKMGKTLINYINNNISDMCVKYMIDKKTELSFDELKNKDINSFIKPDVIIDFSTTEGTFYSLDFASQNLIPIVIATTGFNKKEEKTIREYSEAIPIFKSSNFSYSISLISNILKKIYPLLSDMDIEILEKHHNKKKDAPSGTALLFADSINSVIENKYQYVFDRHNANTVRNKNEIGFSSIRGGNLIGEHSIFFYGEDENIEIKHTSYSRNIYAKGAINAAKFIIQKKCGLYTMEDLINP